MTVHTCPYTTLREMRHLRRAMRRSLAFRPRVFHGYPQHRAYVVAKELESVRDHWQVTVEFRSSNQRDKAPCDRMSKTTNI